LKKHNRIYFIGFDNRIPDHTEPDPSFEKLFLGFSGISPNIDNNRFFKAKNISGYYKTIRLWNDGCCNEKLHQKTG
jgi:hypothetical protein